MPDKDGFPKVLTLESKFPCYKSIARMGAKISDLIVLVNSSAVEVIIKSVSFFLENTMSKPAAHPLQEYLL